MHNAGIDGVQQITQVGSQSGLLLPTKAVPQHHWTNPEPSQAVAWPDRAAAPKVEGRLGHIVRANFIAQL